jgi:hypothetical protein
VQRGPGTGGLEAAVGEGGLLVPEDPLPGAGQGFQLGGALGRQGAAGGGAQARDGVELDEQLDVLVELAVQLAYLRIRKTGGF